VVLCVDEKPQIQALERTAPPLPVRPGHPEAASFDYVRHGTTTLFAALEVATGKVTDACTERHRHQEFLAFLRQVARAYPRRQPVKHHPDGPLHTDNRCYNRLITALRAPAERGHALLGRWRALDRVTVSPQRIGAIAAAALVLTSLDRGSR
jgi:DDE superfamily endonuclease